MPRPIPIVEHAMEVQAGLRSLTKATAPMYEAALLTHDSGILFETHALAQTLKVAMIQARRIAGMAEATCPDDAVGSGHGAAA